MVRRYITDPIHGTIKIPEWLTKLIDEKPIRRMMFIRQLGLKSLIDFPGAIHTRYSHALGVMHLADRLAEMLEEKERNNGNSATADNIQGNKINIVAAGFFHDIGHGPFSHVVDYVLRKYSGVDHSELVLRIINQFSDLENWANPKQVHQIIIGQHEIPFINQIINGPIDADKLDYLLRDSHHVGLKYNFDLNHFINNLLVLGERQNNLKQRELGLSSEVYSRVSAEIFFVIWRSMYDLIYHVKSSRIAEKMFEKSIILRADKDLEFRSRFEVNKAIDGYMELDDDKILSILKYGDDFSARLTNNVIDNNLYKEILNSRLQTRKEDKNYGSETYSIKEPFLSELNDSEKLSDELSIELSNHYKVDKYKIICDIVKSRIPGTVHIDKSDDNGEPMEFLSISKLTSNFDKEIRIKVYASEEIKQISDVNKVLETIISNWKGASK